MPELPEVETVRRGLEPVMTGAWFLAVDLRRADLRFAFPERFAERLVGARVESLGRRAKYLLARLSSGEALVMHLGMSGRFSISPAPRIATGEGRHVLERTGYGAAPHPRPARTGRGDEKGAVSGDVLGRYVHDTGRDHRAHDHVVFQMSSGAAITYSDPRRFGFMQLLGGDELDGHALFKALGVEPLGDALTSEHVAARAAGKRCDLKAFLLDQRIIAGLGNIYVAEALFRARLSPRREASCLADRKGRPTRRAQELVEVIRQVLGEAIEAGGSTLRDHAQTDGSPGSFQQAFAVYGREGEACLRPGCGGVVRRILQGGRSSFYCSRCQR